MDVKTLHLVKSKLYKECDTFSSSRRIFNGIFIFTSYWSQFSTEVNGAHLKKKKIKIKFNEQNNSTHHYTPYTVNNKSNNNNKKQTKTTYEQNKIATNHRFSSKVCRQFENRNMSVGWIPKQPFCFITIPFPVPICSSTCYLYLYIYSYNCM